MISHTHLQIVIPSNFYYLFIILFKKDNILIIFFSLCII